MQTLAEFLAIFSTVRVFNLRSCDLRHTIGRGPLYVVSFSSVYHNTDCWILLVRRKLTLILWPSQEIIIIGTEKRAKVRPTCSIFEQYEPWTELQVKLSLSLLRSNSLKFQPQNKHCCLLLGSIVIKEGWPLPVSGNFCEILISCFAIC